MKRLLSTLAALALVLPLLLSAAAPALANSAQTHWHGTALTGAQIQDKDCPLVVEHEDLTFHISEFPVNSYASQQEFLDYSASVTAEYTFRNPADYTVTATLAFPFGEFPSYGIYTDDTERYGVTVNDAPVSTVLRHTYSPQFSIDDLTLLQNDHLTDDFFSPDLSVTKITYAISEIDEEAYPAASASFTYTPHPSKTRYIVSNYSGGSFDEDKGSIFTWLDNGISFDLYILGEVPDPLPQWTCYENGAMETEIPGSVTPVKTESLTLQELIFKEYDPEQGVSEVDWYNAVTTYLKRNTMGSASIDCTAPMQLMRWYQYEITLGPGETLKNAVTAPLYPEIDLRYAPPLYTYTYLLSPAQTWKSFGDIDIHIETPFCLVDSEDTLEGSTRDEVGWSLHLDGLPEGELIFSLSEAEHPRRTSYALQNLAILLPLILLILLPVAAILVLVLVRRHRRKTTR